MGGISIWQLLIVAVIIVLLFGTKKLRNIGGDLGSAVKGFKKAMNDKDADFDQKQITGKTDANTANSESKKDKNEQV